MQSGYVRVNGMRIHYTVSGLGSNVILVHGLGASVIAWKDNIESLSRTHTVYAVDIPGHGDSDPVNTEYTMDEAVKFVVGFMDQLGIEKTAIVGNSLGGLIALASVLAIPDRFDHLALVGSAGLGKQISLPLRIKTLRIVGEILEKASAKTMLRHVFHDGNLIPTSVLDELRRTRRKPWAKTAVLAMLRQGVNINGLKPDLLLTSRLNEIKCPILIVWGNEDRIFPVQQARDAMMFSEGVTLKIFPQCGHWPQMEKAQDFNNILIRFLGL